MNVPPYEINDKYLWWKTFAPNTDFAYIVQLGRHKWPVNIHVVAVLQMELDVFFVASHGENMRVKDAPSGVTMKLSSVCWTGVLWLYTICYQKTIVTIMLSKEECHLNVSPRVSLFNERPLPLYNKASRGNMSCERSTQHVENLSLRIMAEILVISTRLLLE